MSASVDQPARTEPADRMALPPRLPGASAGAGEPLIVDIYPRKGWQAVRWGDLWEFRDLLWLMMLRDVTVRYKQTVLGAAWAVLQPLLQMLIFTVFFGWLMGMETKVHELSPGKLVPYAIFTLSGQVLWNCFSATVSAASSSLVGNANMLRKIYFPRLLMPVAASGAPSADCVVAMGLLLATMGYYWFFPGANHYEISFSPLLILAPLFLFLTVITALGVGILLSALTVAYRDFKYVVPFMIQIWFFVTPVLYPVKILPERLRWLLYLNPMAGTIEAFRGIVFGNGINFLGLGLSLAVSLVILFVGVTYFTRVERDFADLA